LSIQAKKAEAAIPQMIIAKAIQSRRLLSAIWLLSESSCKFLSASAFFSNTVSILSGASGIKRLFGIRFQIDRLAPSES
jgi:hypothetical protein